jgi:hypothetical protein
MDERTKHFWRLRAAFQELFGITDEEEKVYPEIGSLFNLCANLALYFKEKGTQNFHSDEREKILKEMGVILLKRRDK